ncbi:MAG: ABC transporter ATP-binding protein, partial [Chloroflexi bacterium]
SRYIRPQRGRFTLLTLLILGGIGLQVVNPQIMRFFIDTAQNGGAQRTLMLAAGAFIGIAVLQQLVSVLVTYLGENVAWTATNALRTELAWHCLNLDMSFHNDHTPGEMIERIDGDVTELANFFSQLAVTIIGNGLLMVGILAALYLEDWRIGLAFTLFSVVTLAALLRVRDIAVEPQKARRQAEADLFGFVEEQLTSTEDVRSSGAIGFSLRELQRLQANIFRHDRKAHQKGWIIGNVMGGMMAVGTIMAIGAGYLLFQGGAITVGTVYMLIYYITLLEQPIWTMTRQVQNFQTIGACVERLTELRKIQPREQMEPANGAGLGLTAPNPLPAGALALLFDGVSFKYEPVKNGPETPLVLQDLAFALQPGGVLGLLGRTGSGKTTLTRLVFRLYEPSAGQIRLGGQNVSGIPLQALRQRIGIVTQEVQLFRASVRDNLTFFDPTIPDERSRAVLEELELGDWYRALPQGLDTLLTTGGHSLSAGEAQLLAFARIFLRDPGLVILDEASS